MMATVTPLTKTASVKKTIPQQTSFAKIDNIADHFKLSINLKYFEGFKEDDCNVEVKGRDLLVDCKKKKFDKPDSGFREVHVLYRLPEDTDVSTVKMSRTGMKVKVEAMRQSYGKPLSLAVCDVTKKNANVQIMGGMA